MNYQTVLMMGFAFFIGYFFINLFLIGDKKQTPSSRVDDTLEKEADAWFVVLDVAKDASEEEIKKAYIAKIREYHPDKVASLGVELQHLAEEKTKEINRAYEEALKGLAHRH